MGQGPTGSKVLDELSNRMISDGIRAVARFSRSAAFTIRSRPAFPLRSVDNSNGLWDLKRPRHSCRGLRERHYGARLFVLTALLLTAALSALAALLTTLTGLIGLVLLAAVTTATLTATLATLLTATLLILIAHYVHSIIFHEVYFFA
jgi:hypothetical protein